jgi:hypothetical protein
MLNLNARLETIKACWVGIASLLIHCDTAERLKPHSLATFDGPPKATRSSFISPIDPPCEFSFNINKFTKCNYYLQQFWSGESFFSWSFIISVGKKSRANRQMMKFQAFLKSFANGRYDWTLYFNWAVLKKNNLYKSHAFFKWLRLEQKWERKSYFWGVTALP